MKKSKQLVNLGNVTIDDVVMYDGTTKMGCLGGDVIYASAAGRLFIDTLIKRVLSILSLCTP